MVTTDRDTLVALFQNTNGDDWKRRGNWATNAEVPQWYGVNANGQGRVVDLSLASNNLRGSVLSRLGNLGALQGLNLEANRLTGPIPVELGALSKLEVLRLDSNHLTGAIPTELGNLRALKVLRLSRNSLSGTIPKELGSLRKLEMLRLSNNELSGPIPKELGALTKLKRLSLFNNQLTGGIPKELGALSKLERLWLRHNHLTGEIPQELGNLRALMVTDAPGHRLTGGSLTRWQEKLRDARLEEPWAISLVEVLVALWHFFLPVVDDVTDVILLWATFTDRGGLWWACCGAFVLADAERVLLLLVTLTLIVCWIPFSLAGTNETRGERFQLPLRILNGWDDLRLEPIFVRYDDRGDAVFGIAPSALRWPVLDGFMWAVVGSRSKSSSLMSLCGMSGNMPVGVLAERGFGLSLIDRIVRHHPYSMLGRAMFACPHRHHLPGTGVATRRSGVMLRAVGETLVVDSLFLALSLSSETWEDGVSIGIFSLIFSVLELLTELQYYATEARADMVTGSSVTRQRGVLSSASSEDIEEVDDRQCGFVLVCPMR